MRLCSYVVRFDAGSAPNPYWGYCTLAFCTPNHQGIRLEPGDWVMGNSTRAAGQCLVYAMRISEVIAFEDYYADPRFARKKPRLGGTWAQGRGDNIYHRGPDRLWIQDPNGPHDTEEQLRQDTKHPRVFVSDYYFYFGRKAPPIPEEFGGLIQNRQGVQCITDAALISGFVNWLETSFRPGRLGDPSHAPNKRSACGPPAPTTLRKESGGVC